MSGSKIRHVAVIDIGKTNAKLALVDTIMAREADFVTMPNRVIRSSESYPHYDVEAVWQFLIGSFSRFQARHGIDAISTTTHGATAALLAEDGTLALPVLDYEYEEPDRLRSEYDRIRPDFAETGSPPLPMGLNLGAQLFWLEKTYPDAFARTASILMYPQYWGYRLTGVMANEVTSLGCHTDLWSPDNREYSSLVNNMQLRERLAPLRSAHEQLGQISRQIAEKTGLPGKTPVYVGIHDSNASLVPHLNSRQAPFSVVSTGTWVVCMSIGGLACVLDKDRDTLVNVSARGDSVPSARFMGGREFEKLTALCGVDRPTSAGIEEILRNEIMILPSVQPGSGPFPGRSTRTIGKTSPSEEAQLVAASFYLAAMTSVCLHMTGARGETVVEGPFARNRLYLEILSSITERPVIISGSGATGTSIGAAMLCVEDDPVASYDAVNISKHADQWKSHFRNWLRLTTTAK